MKALFAVGLAVAILGILSFFVAIPHSENHGIKAGDVNIGVQYPRQRKDFARYQRRDSGGRGRTHDRRPRQELAAAVTNCRLARLLAQEAACDSGAKLRRS